MKGRNVLLLTLSLLAVYLALLFFFTFTAAPKRSQQTFAPDPADKIADQMVAAEIKRKKLLKADLDAKALKARENKRF